MNKKKINIAAVISDVDQKYLKKNFNIYKISRENINDVVNKKIDFFLFKPDNFIQNNEKEILEFLKSAVIKFKYKKILTVYWNDVKELSNNYFKFISKNFDYIFTDKKENFCNGNNVFNIKASINPFSYNPIGLRNRNNSKYIFIGSLGEVYRKSIIDFQFLVNEAKEKRIQIYETFSNDEMSYNIYWMNSYLKFINGFIVNNKKEVSGNDFIKNEKLISNYNLLIFQLLASGYNILSYGMRLNKKSKLLNVIKNFNNPVSLVKYYERLQKDNILSGRLSLMGHRYVLRYNNIRIRLNDICNKMGLEGNAFQLPGISILLITNKLNFMKNIFANFNRQNYINKEMIIVLNNNKMILGEWKNKTRKYKNIFIYQVDEKKVLGECLNFALKKSKYEYITKFDDDDYYCKEFLNDFIDAFDYCNTKVVGKRAALVYFLKNKTFAIDREQGEYSYILGGVRGGALIVKREVFNKVPFPKIPNNIDGIFCKNCIENGFKIYSTDIFNYVYFRFPNQEIHTWKMSDESYIFSKCRVLKDNNYKKIAKV